MKLFDRLKSTELTGSPMRKERDKDFFWPCNPGIMKLVVFLFHKANTIGKNVFIPEPLFTEESPKSVSNYSMCRKAFRLY